MDIVFYPARKDDWLDLHRFWRSAQPGEVVLTIGLEPFKKGEFGNFNQGVSSKNVWLPKDLIWLLGETVFF